MTRSPSPTTAPTERRSRKATCVRRREQIAELKHQVLVLRRELTRERRTTNADRRAGQLHALVVAAQQNDALDDALRAHHLWRAGLRGQLDSWTVADPGACALYMPIHMTVDADERHELLRRLHPLKIRVAQEFVAVRSGDLDLATPFRSVHRFADASTREPYEVHFVVQPFPGVHSVWQVFDAMRFWMDHFEICITEQLGDLTVREDEAVGEDHSVDADMEASGFASHRRLHSTLPNGVVLEGNVVFFRQFDRDANRAVLTIQSVDSDALHPYQPIERVRQEILGVMVITQPSSGDGTVTMTRWLRMRIPQTPSIGRDDAPAITPQEGIARWEQVLQRVLQERLAVATAGRC